MVAANTLNTLSPKRHTNQSAVFDKVNTSRCPCIDECDRRLLRLVAENVVFNRALRDKLVVDIQIAFVNVRIHVSLFT